jgi:hypothetical protein
MLNRQFPLRNEPDMNLKLAASALLAALLVVPAIADDEANGKQKRKRGARNNAATQFLKQLEPVGLTDDQVAKVKELGKAAWAKMKEIRDDAGITAAVTKKRAEAVKSLKDSDKKGKERQAAINKAAGLSDAQVSALAKQNEVRVKFQKEVVALLSDEQKEKLPQRIQRAVKAGAKGKRKKKKDDA